MRTIKATISILVILFSSSLVYDNALGQVTKRNRIELSFSDMVPHSKVVFKRSYGGIIGVDLTYLRKVKSHLLFGGLFEHSRFKLDDPEVIKATPNTRHTKSNISSGAIVGGVEYPLNKIINATFQIGLGYSWISLKNKPNNFSHKESGPMLRPLFAIQFLSSKVGLSLSIAYPIVFEDFADDVGLDDATTRWGNFSGGIVYSF